MGTRVQAVLENARRGQRGLGLVSVLGLSAAILSYLWWGRFQYRSDLYLALTYLAGGGLILLNHVVFGDRLREMGIRLDNLARSAALFLTATAVPALLILLLGLAAGNYRPEPTETLAVYFGWALLQQHVLQNFFFLRLRQSLKWPSHAAVGAAFLFALLHSPNWALVTLTFLGGLFWCWLFYRSPNLWMATVSHWLLATLLLLFFKADTLQFAVGRAGFRYEAYGGGVLVAGGRDAEGFPVVVTVPGPDRGKPSLVKVFHPDGTLLKSWNAFPTLDFSGQLAMGDLGFEAGDEVVLAPGPVGDNPAQVKIYSLEGRKLGEFEVARREGFGAWVAVFEGTVLLAPGPAPGQKAEVLQFLPDGKLLNHWFLDTGLANGIRVAGLSDPLPRHPPWLLVWGNPLAVNPARVHLFRGDQRQREWQAYATTWGLNLSPVRLGEGKLGVVTAPGPLRGYSAHLRVFDLEGRELQSFVPDAAPSACGGNVAALDLDGNGRDEIVLGEGTCGGAGSTIRVLDLAGNLLYQWEAY